MQINLGWVTITSEDVLSFLNSDNFIGIYVIGLIIVSVISFSIGRWFYNCALKYISRVDEDNRSLRESYDFQKKQIQEMRADLNNTKNSAITDGRKKSLEIYLLKHTIEILEHILDNYSLFTVEYMNWPVKAINETSYADFLNDFKAWVDNIPNRLNSPTSDPFLLGEIIDESYNYINRFGIIMGFINESEA